MREIASVVHTLTTKIYSVEQVTAAGKMLLTELYSGEESRKMYLGSLRQAIADNIFRILAYRDEVPWED